MKVGDMLRNVHTGEVVPVLAVGHDSFTVPGGPKDPNDQEWDIRTFGVEWQATADPAQKRA
jgi:hypothetical protein